MYENVGQVASESATSKMGAPPPLRGASPPVLTAFDGLGGHSPDPSVDLSPFTTVVRRLPSSGADPASALHGAPAGSQSGLPYFWQNNAPVVPQITSARLAALRLKRGMDLLLALVSVIVFAPVFIMAAMAIKLTSKGPVFFKQERTGLQNRPFRVYKFRTMYVDRQDPSGVRQTTEEDPRITPVGKILRRTSLDEVPQIINILKGDMSFVGPRPHVPGMLAGGLPYEELVPYYDLRHAMKPGLTGWAQANGFRGPTIDPIRARQRVDHDIAYVQNFAIRLDVAIIAKTAWREFVTGTGV